MITYADFLASKAPVSRAIGIEPQPMPSHLRDYQCDVTAFSLRMGSAGNFLDTGLGKTACELEWCRQAADASNGRALLLTPLAVARQIEAEAHRWGYKARVIRSQDDADDGINICNYDRLDLLRPDEFGAVAMDESSILKSFTGSTTRALIAAFTGHRFRLCATATPAPNDHMELGQHAEFLGQMSSMEMLSRWFINDTSTASQNWRLKGHAAASFWDWMASWSRCAETPADLGCDATGFTLPLMQITRHQVAGDVRAPAGMLFVQDVSATNLHDIKRQTAEARADSVAALVHAEPGESWVVWCDTDYEADALAKRMPNAVEVRGGFSIERKEAALAAFADGSARVIITKPSICGYGLNWQHCARMAFVGRSFSYEAWYQAVRRCWRYGQARCVQVHLMVAEGEDQIGRVIDRKSCDHITMKRAMAAAMKRVMAAQSGPKVTYNPTYIGRTPTWLKSAA
jgi:hypothetical protein